MRVAVDALGGDNAPAEVVSGTIQAARRLPEDEFILVGDEDAIQPELSREVPANVSLQPARGVVGMDEEPAVALRARPESSVAVAARMVRTGEADAFFSAGSTGATVAAGLLEVGRLEGCRRPAIAAILPFDEPGVLLDAGATIACRPQDLLNFAILGSVFAERYLDVRGAPRVGLLNVGEESSKGNELTREAYALLTRAKGLRFVGNVEGRDIGRGVADVFVADGFTGNVVLKTAEGVAREILGMVRRTISLNAMTKIAGSVLRPRLVAVRNRLDPESYGSSFLLGIKGLVAIGHGNSSSKGVQNAMMGISRAGADLITDSAAAIAVAKDTA